MHDVLLMHTLKCQMLWIDVEFVEDAKAHHFKSYYAPSVVCGSTN